MNLVARDIERAADSVRAANHSTMRGALSPQEVHAAVGHLDDLARRLPQVLGFLGRSLGRAEPAAYRDDRGHEPAITLLGAQAASPTPPTTSSASPATSCTPTTTSAASPGCSRRTDP